ncbi:MAG: tetratricopeptide repeat protein [bacterium]
MMLRKKYFLFYTPSFLIIFLLVLTTSCRKGEKEKEKLTETMGEIKAGETPLMSETGEGYVSAGPLNLRSQPSKDGKVITVLGKDEPITALEKSTNEETIDGITAPWYRVKTKTGDEGWVFGGYIRFGKPSEFDPTANTSVSIDMSDIPNGMPAYDYYKLGKTFYDEENYKKALPYLLKSVEVYENEGKKDKQYGWALFFVGTCYQELGDHNKAIDIYNKVLPIMPDYFWLYNNIGLSYIRVGNKEKAIEYLEKALTLTPDSNKENTLKIAQRNLEIAKSMK